jgi:hypothetical protein
MKEHDPATTTLYIFGRDGTSLRMWAWSHQFFTPGPGFCFPFLAMLNDDTNINYP